MKKLLLLLVVAVMLVVFIGGTIHISRSIERAQVQEPDINQMLAGGKVDDDECEADDDDFEGFMVVDGVYSLQGGAFCGISC